MANPKAFQPHIIEIRLPGETRSEDEGDQFTLNPYLDYYVVFDFTYSDGAGKVHRFSHRGYFAGDGGSATPSATESGIPNAGSAPAATGDKWHCKVSFPYDPHPNGTNQWNWTVRVRKGAPGIRDMDPDIPNGSRIGITKLGDPMSIPGVQTIIPPVNSGLVTVDPIEANAGIFSKGFLSYVQRHYCRFRKFDWAFNDTNYGEWWLDAGLNSPENIFATECIDGTWTSRNTSGGSGWKNKPNLAPDVPTSGDHIVPYCHDWDGDVAGSPSHRSDWQSGDPRFTRDDGFLKIPFLSGVGIFQGPSADLGGETAGEKVTFSGSGSGSGQIVFIDQSGSTGTMWVLAPGATASGTITGALTGATAVAGSTTAARNSDGLIGLMNYLAGGAQTNSADHDDVQVTSLYSLVMSLGGDAEDCYPYVTQGLHQGEGYPAGEGDYRMHFDLSKMDHWQIVFEYMQRQGIVFKFVLAEREEKNLLWLGGYESHNSARHGEMYTMRRVFFAEMVARFGWMPGMTFIIVEELQHSAGQKNPPPNITWELDHVRDQVDYIRHWDYQMNAPDAVSNPYWGRPICFHTETWNVEDEGSFPPYDLILGERRFTSSSMQPALDDNWRNGRWMVDMYREASAGSNTFDLSDDALRAQKAWVWPLFVDEPFNNLVIAGGSQANPTGSQNDWRRRFLWPVYFGLGQANLYVSHGKDAPTGNDQSVESGYAFGVLLQNLRYMRTFLEEFAFWAIHWKTGILDTSVVNNTGTFSYSTPRAFTHGATSSNGVTYPRQYAVYLSRASTQRGALLMQGQNIGSTWNYRWYHCKLGVWDTASTAALINIGGNAHFDMQANPPVPGAGESLQDDWALRIWPV